MSHWQVRAQRMNKHPDPPSVCVFGVQADTRDMALLLALDRVPWQPDAIDVSPVPPGPDAGGATFADHAGHDGDREDCRFCRV